MRPVCSFIYHSSMVPSVFSPLFLTEIFYPIAGRSVRVNCWISDDQLSPLRVRFEIPPLFTPPRSNPKWGFGQQRINSDSWHTLRGFVAAQSVVIQTAPQLLPLLPHTETSSCKYPHTDPKTAKI